MNIVDGKAICDASDKLIAENPAFKKAMEDASTFAVDEINLKLDRLLPVPVTVNGVPSVGLYYFGKRIDQPAMLKFIVPVDGLDVQPAVPITYKDVNLRDLLAEALEAQGAARSRNDGILSAFDGTGIIEL